MKAGTARANITPAVGAKSNGGVFESVATELYAKALVLDDGKTKAAIVTADVILLGKSVVAETRERIEKASGIPGASVMFAASHTHSGAVTTMRERWSDIEPDHGYVDQLVAKMSGSVKVFEQIQTWEVGEIRISSKEVALPLLPHPSVESVEAQLKQKRKKGEDATWEEKTLASLRDGTAPTAITGEVQLLRLGPDIALAAIPGELFAEIGLRMKEGLACKHPFIVGYANGYVGYLPSAASCREDGEKLRYDWHKIFWYPSNFTEGVEPTLLSAARELAQSSLKQEIS